ncbi:MAG: TylF/MycF/NovP-related O-methyltransferase [Candidatus Kuenenbacteria bacterium]
MIKKIAWGTSKLLKMYLENNKSNQFSYCIDDFSRQKSIYGLPIVKSNILKKEKRGSFQIVIFAVSNRSLQEISQKLNQMGISYSQDFIYYSDFFYKQFLAKAKKNLNIKFNPQTYKYALSYTLNSSTLIHTTILGTWLFLDLLKATSTIKGSIAEVGIFQGGNALCALHFTANNKHHKKFYLLDSFEGFAKPSFFDPQKCKKGDYKIETTYQQIVDTFAPFNNTKLIKGFVPMAFKQIPSNKKFSLVFYDCDLYQPALDSFEYFWPKITKGGYLLIHDYHAEKGGFEGVRQATDEFFKNKKVSINSFYENTMAVIKK